MLSHRRCLVIRVTHWKLLEVVISSDTWRAIVIPCMILLNSYFEIWHMALMVIWQRESQCVRDFIFTWATARVFHSMKAVMTLWKSYRQEIHIQIKGKYKAGKSYLPLNIYWHLLYYKTSSTLPFSCSIFLPFIARWDMFHQEQRKLLRFSKIQ